MTNPTREQIQSLIRQLAPLRGLDPEIICRQCDVESGSNQAARSPVGAIGAMQLMPKTAEGLKVDPFDWKQNVEGGVRLMGVLLKSYGGDYAKALAAYNCGPARLRRAMESGDDWREVLPPETRKYITKILEPQHS